MSKEALHMKIIVIWTQKIMSTTVCSIVDSRFDAVCSKSYSRTEMS